MIQNIFWMFIAIISVLFGLSFLGIMPDPIANRILFFEKTILWLLCLTLIYNIIDYLIGLKRAKKIAIEKAKKEEKKSRFTIVVKREDKEKDFKIEDLVMRHKECHDGIIIKHESEIYCRRCGISAKLKKTPGVLSELIETAIDGKRRETDEFIVIGETDE